MIQGRPCLASITGVTPFKPALQIKRELGLTQLDRMGANENPLGPSPKAIAAMVAAAQEAQYYPDAGSWDLRRALADRFNWPVEGIVVEAGITGLLRVSVEAFCEPGDLRAAISEDRASSAPQGVASRVVYPWPSYANYPLTVLPLGATPVPVQGKGLEPDWEAMAREAQTAKLVWLCNPNNPTGLQYGNTEIRWLLERLPAGCLLMVDEAYHEFGDQESAMELLREGHPIVVMRTFAKAYGLAGLRVGYGLMPPAIADWFNRAREPFQVSSIAQAAALAALDDQEHLDRSIQVVREGRAFLAAEVAKLGITVIPSAANFMLLHFGKDCRPLAGALLKQGIMVRATDDIFALPGYLRVTVGTREMNERFVAALGALLA